MNTENETPALSVFLIINRQIIPLTKQITRLGRQLDNDIVLHDETISRFHAEIHLEGGKYVIHDKGSTSGTSINNRRIESCILNSGDMISLANLTMMFVDNNSRIANSTRITTKNLQPDSDPNQ